MKSILVTGANGQLGSELKNISNIPGFNFIFTDIEELDITNLSDLDTFFTNNNIDFIVNCAAYNAVDKAESEPDKADLINNIAVKNLVDLARKHNCFIIHVSTDYVFNGNNFRPYIEDDQVNPESSYGKSKLKGEKAIKGYPKGAIIRTSWLYSSYGNNFVKTMLRLGKEKDELKVIFDQVGTPTYAADLANAIINIIALTNESPANFKDGIYHFSNEGVCSWYDFAIEIMNIAKLNCKITAIETKDYPLPAKRPFYSVLNKSKIKNTFGVTVPHWKESLKKCLEQLI